MLCRLCGFQSDVAGIMVAVNVNVCAVSVGFSRKRQAVRWR